MWPLRVPFVSGVILVGLPTAGFLPAFRPFLSGLFDPVGKWALAPIASLALFNAWTIVIIVSLILRYGHIRLELPPTGVATFPLPWGWWLASSLVLAGPVIWRTIAYSNATRWGWPLITGITLAIVLAVIASLVRKWFGKRRRQKDSLLRQALAILARFPILSMGFLEQKPEGFAVAPGHGLAFGLSAGSVFLYVALWLLTGNVTRPVLASALGYLLLLTLMLTWLIGFTAFLFDRVRIPIVLVLTGWIFLVTYVLDRVWPTDHLYHTVTRQQETPLPSVSQLLAGTQTPILVAASGGGIQAAAWTARVMTSLDSIVGFRQSVRLISAVSGGSVGTMNLLAGWQSCGPDTPARDSQFNANQASRESSLHAVGWGLVFQDLPRWIFPILVNPYIDRGLMLENAWKREPRLTRPYLSDWRNNVAAHQCPGVVFNSMVAETGEPMLFSTIDLPETLAPFSFYRRYPDRDLAITTAVRLSAAFPYVSAASRADVDDESNGYSHLVDGGYFDNYGVGSLSAVADAALRTISEPAGKGKLLVIEICDAKECSGQKPPGTPSRGGKRRGWPYQILAPLSALVAERSAAQRVSNRTALGLLTEEWRARSTCIESVPVPLGSDEAPMSWHLTQAEKDAIDSAWNNLDVSQHIVRAVANYVGGGSATKGGAACLAERAAEGAKPKH